MKSRANEPALSLKRAPRLKFADSQRIPIVTRRGSPRTESAPPNLGEAKRATPPASVPLVKPLSERPLRLIQAIVDSDLVVAVRYRCEQELLHREES
jgi:hypothetical protein